MGIKNKIAQYRQFKEGVSHCTFDPEGPGVVRIHLVPPKFRLFRSSAYIVILNGYYLLPIGYSWALILSCFMKEVNRFHGKSIRAYGKHMTAPHRMDLMVSAMTDGDGKWQCNQKCLFCYAAGQKMAATKELSTSQWKQVIDRLEEARVPMVTFTGG